MRLQVITQYNQQYDLKWDLNNITSYEFYQNYQNNIDGNTIAMWQAQQGCVPDDFFLNDPELQNYQGDTVAMLIAKYVQEIPSTIWQHDPSLKNKNGEAVALILAYNGIIPPKEWSHNKLFRMVYCDINSKIRYFTVQNFLEIQHVEVPLWWKYDDNLDYSGTEAMIQAINRQMPEQQYYHDPSLKNIYGKTVAMLLAENGIIPPKEWEHNSNLQDNQDLTVAMILAGQRIEPPKQWYHSSDIQDCNGWTVAMYIVQYCQNFPQEQWYHNPALQNNQGITVAMLFAQNYQYVPSEWHHDPKLCDKQNRTVAYYLRQNKCKVPKEWLD